MMPLEVPKNSIGGGKYWDYVWESYGITGIIWDYVWDYIWDNSAKSHDFLIFTECVLMLGMCHLCHSTGNCCDPVEAPIFFGFPNF
jgi:hypothetical protein